MYKLRIRKIARYIELENFSKWVLIIVMSFETNNFFQFIWWIQNPSTVSIYYYSNVKAHSMKKL